MTWTVWTYATYLVVAVPLTVWVATTLARNGKAFLADVFEQQQSLAEAVNQLLVVGFYLVNLGFVLLYLRAGGAVSSLTGLLDTVSLKVGLVMLVLGVIHFGNVLLFNAIRRRGRLESARAAMVPAPSYQPPMPPFPTSPR